MIVKLILSFYILVAAGASSEQGNMASTKCTHTTHATNRLIFASCNRQLHPQSFWPALKSLKPDGFVWLGDAVYAKDTSVEKLSLAYQTLLKSASYAEFAKSTHVTGTWDDHGKHIVFLNAIVIKVSLASLALV